jgi:hypothetical protein
MSRPGSLALVFPDGLLRKICQGLNTYTHFTKGRCRETWVFFSLKGLFHEMNIFWRLIIKNRYRTFCTCAGSWNNFCFSVDEKIKFKTCSFEFLQILNIFPETRFTDLKVATLILKMYTCDSVKKHTGSHMWQAISWHERTSTNHRVGNSEEGFVFSKHFQNWKVISKMQIKS